MIRIIFFVLLMNSYIQAQSCYSVELMSVHKNGLNLKNLQNEKSHSPECEFFSIGNYITLRCGCFNKYRDAEIALKKYKKTHTKAYIALTKEERFKSKKKNHSSLLLSASSDYKKLKMHTLELTPKLLKNVIILKNMNNEYFSYVFSSESNLSIIQNDYQKVFSKCKFVDVNRSTLDTVIDFSFPPEGFKVFNEGKNKYEVSYSGEYKPKIANINDVKFGTKKNRRVEIKVIPSPDNSIEPFCESILYTGKLKEKTLEERQSYIYQNCENKEDNTSLIDFNVTKVDDNNELNTSLENYPIVNLMALLKQNNTKYLNILKDKDPFYGVYLGGKYEKYIDEEYIFRHDVDYEYRVNLRWEIFDDGFFESKKNIQRKVNETQVQYLQLISDMIDRNYDEKLFDVQLMKSEIRYTYFNLIANTYVLLLNKREKQLQDGYTTINDVDHVRERVENLRMQKDFYNSQERKEVDRKLFAFLNTIECVELIDKESLKEYEINNNTQLKLQDKFIRRSEFFPEYIDNLKLNVFTEYRNVHTIGWYETVGVEVDLPIDWDDERSRIIRLEQSNYKIQKYSIKKRLEQNTDSLYYQFNYHQTQLKVMQNALKYLYKREYELKDINNNIIRGFKDDPDREKDLLKIKIIEKKYEILMKRIDIYEILLRLYHLSNADNIQFLIKN